MPCSLTTIQAEACLSGIGKEQSRIKLLQWIAQLTCEAAEAAGGGGGATAFTQLTDVPNSYAGQSGNFLRVNAGETGLEFLTLAQLGPLVTPSGNGGPIGVVTPAFVGQYYTDLNGPGIFVSNGLTNNDWIAF